MRAEHHATVITRQDLAQHANELGITVAVEVGTDLGVFAGQFLERWRGEMLLCVDPYRPYNEMPYCRDGDFMAAVVALSKFHGRVKFIREDSVPAAGKLPTWLQPGLVYIDGDHSFEAVQEDLAAWWDVLTPGGIFAGHDYWDRHPGVPAAVDEFARTRGMKLWCTHEATAPSWFIEKPRS